MKKPKRATCATCPYRIKGCDKPVCMLPYCKYFKRRDTMVVKWTSGDKRPGV